MQLEEVRAIPDAFGRAPLTAVIIVRHDDLHPSEVQAISLEIEGPSGSTAETVIMDLREQPYDQMDLSSLVSADEFAIPVLGLYQGVVNHVRIRISAQGQTFLAEVDIPTPMLVEGEEPVVHVKEPAEMEPGFTFVSGPDINTGRVYDSFGNLRWVGPMILDVTEDGQILSGTEKLNWLGQTLETWPLPEYLSFHHDAQELESGHLIVAVNDQNTTVKTASGETVTSVEDAIVEVDAAGQVVEYWDLREFLDVDRQTVSNQGADWAHVNSIAFDETQDALYVSSRYQGVIKLVGRHAEGDPVTTGKSLAWVFAPHMGWGRAGAEGELDSSPADFLLTATDQSGKAFDSEVQENLSAPLGDADDFHWPIGQHGVLVERGGERISLTTFNNQASFLFDGPDSVNNGSTFTQWGDLSNDRSAQPYSLAVRYLIDEEARTVSEEFRFGEGMSEFYGSFNGGVRRMKHTGNLMTNSNGSSQHEDELGLNNHIIELNPEGSPVFHLEIVKPKISAYRAGRIVFYSPAR